MPCRCDGYPDIPDEHKGEAADALCKILREHEKRGEMGCFDKKTLAWWEEHKRRDAEKAARDAEYEARKAKRKAALNKLSKAEREALGIYRDE